MGQSQHSTDEKENRGEKQMHAGGPVPGERECPDQDPPAGDATRQQP